MFSKIILVAATIGFALVSGIAATFAATGGHETATRKSSTAAAGECYEMPTYKWDPETQTNKFVGYRRICR